MKRIVFLLVAVAALVTGASAETRSRWVFVGQNVDDESVYIDTKTVEFPTFGNSQTGDYVTFWWKIARRDGSETMTHAQIRRSIRYYRRLKWSAYSATHEVTGSSTPGAWEGITPGSIADMLCDFFDAVVEELQHPTSRKSSDRTTNM